MIRAVVAVGLGILAAGYMARREVAPAAAGGDQPDTQPQVAPETFPQAVTDLADQAIETARDAAASTAAMLFGTKYDGLINSAAAEYCVDPRALFNLLNTESHFRDDIITGKVRSKTGALGIAQFMPATAIQELGSLSAALDPVQAIPGAARYLAKLAKSFGGDWTKAVAAYNWGIGNVQKKGLGAAPPETVAYVQSILGVNIA